MAAIEGQPSLWQALAGRAPLSAPGPVDTDVWAAVVERLNPARATPVLRVGVEAVEQVSVRGERYVMVRSPDREGRYVRLRPEEWELARRMDGATTVAALVGQFVRISGRLAPEQVRRVVADLASHRMLEELPVDVFHGLAVVHHRPVPARVGHRLLDAVRGRRIVLANPDRFVGFLYRSGVRHLFSGAGAVGLGVLSVVGFGVFVARWLGGARQVFVAGNSYLVGVITLIVLNAVCLAAHELGHALGVKHAGRRTTAAGVLLYYGIPSVFVDTTDVWMADRRKRLLTSAAGPVASVSMAGIVLCIGEVWPGFAPLAFKLAFAWYLNTLFNLNPLLALDGYYLLMDWLEVPNLRGRGLPMFLRRVRQRTVRWSGLAGEERILVMYGAAAAVWLIVTPALLLRIWKDRLSGVVLGLWRQAWWSRLGLLVIVAALVAPLLHLLVGWIASRSAVWRARVAARQRLVDQPLRLDALRASSLGRLPEPALEALARSASWLHPRLGRAVLVAGSTPAGGFLVASGALQARARGDPTGTIREHVGIGEVAALVPAWRAEPTPLSWEPLWTPVRTKLLFLPAAVLAATLGSPDSFEMVPPVPPPDATEPDEVLAGHYGVHSAGVYPAVWPPPGPPAVLPMAKEVDRRLTRKFAWLLLLFLLLSVASLVTALQVASRSWVEIPSYTAVLSVRAGYVDATIDGRTRRLHVGDERLVRIGDSVIVPEEAVGRLTFRGGAVVDLCPVSAASVEELGVGGRRRLTPRSTVRLDEGRAIADTDSRATDFRSLALRIHAGDHEIANTGNARFAVDGPSGRTVVASGSVARDNQITEPRPPPVMLGCMPGVGVTGGPEPAPSTTPVTLVSTVPNGTVTAPAAPTTLSPVPSVQQPAGTIVTSATVPSLPPTIQVVTTKKPTTTKKPPSSTTSPPTQPNPTTTTTSPNETTTTHCNPPPPTTQPNQDPPPPTNPNPC